MRRTLPLLLLLAACSRPPVAAPGPVEVRVADSPERVWTALLEVYTDAGIPIENMDRASWFLRSESIGAQAGGRTLGRPNAEVFDCGAERGRAMRGLDPRMADRAGSVPITYSVTTLLKPTAGGETALRVSVIAREGTTQCTSKGVIEGQLATAVRARLGRGSE